MLIYTFTHDWVDARRARPPPRSRACFSHSLMMSSVVWHVTGLRRTASTQANQWVTFTLPS